MTPYQEAQVEDARVAAKWSRTLMVTMGFVTIGLVAATVVTALAGISGETLVGIVASATTSVVFAGLLKWNREATRRYDKIIDGLGSGPTTALGTTPS